MNMIYQAIIFILIISTILIFLAYLVVNPEEGDFSAYQKSSNYKFLESSDGLTAYRDFGSQDNTPIIVIHGGTLPSEGYTEFCQSLTKYDYWVICYDQYGRGYSDRPKIKYSMDIYQKQLDDLLDHLNIKKFILYGISMGAPIAINYANNNIDQTLAVGLQVPVVDIDNNIFKLLKAPVLGNIFMRFFGLPTIKKRALEWDANDDEKIFIDKYIAQLRMPGTEYALLSAIRNLFSKDYTQSYKEFSKHNIPLHIAYANDDQEISPDSIKSVIKYNNHADVFVFSGGHSGSALIPKKIVSIFTKFLNDSLN